MVRNRKLIQWGTGALVLVASLLMSQVKAADYVIDTKGAHAFVQFRVKHIGYSWLYGRFDSFSGTFSYDEKAPEKSKVDVEVDLTSLDSNHAERDKHLRSDEYLNVAKYAKAKFISTKYEKTGEKTGKLTGNLTLFGTTKPIIIDVEHIGAGTVPWNPKEYHMGFEGRSVIKPVDFGLDMAAKLGPASAEVELMLTVEGIRQ